MMRLGRVTRLEHVTRVVEELVDNKLIKRNEPNRVYGYLCDLSNPKVEITFNPLKMDQLPAVGDYVGFLLDNRSTDKIRAYKVYVGKEIEPLLANKNLPEVIK